MCLVVVARRQVGVLIALVQPRIEVAGETRRRHGARFHAVFQRLELSEQLRAAVNVEPLVDADYLHCKQQRDPFGLVALS